MLECFIPMKHSFLLVVTGFVLFSCGGEPAAPLLAKYADSPVKLSLASVCAPAVHGILERASGYDLIVLGSHGRRGVSRFFLGSVAEATVRRAPCSVLVTRAEREADPA